MTNIEARVQWNRNIRELGHGQKWNRTGSLQASSSFMLGGMDHSETMTALLDSRRPRTITCRHLGMKRGLAGCQIYHVQVKRTTRAPSASHNSTYAPLVEMLRHMTSVAAFIAFPDEYTSILVV